MTGLEQVRTWLKSYPGMDRLTDLRVDAVGAGAGSGGLFPQGITELERKEDILGNVEVLNQYQFQLTCVFARPEGDDEAAAANETWLQDLQTWVQERSARGQVPQPGGGAYSASAKAEKGMLKGMGADGTATYTVALTIKTKERYEV